MIPETSCPNCHGTGSVPALWWPGYEPQPGDYAHPFEVVCGCGAWASVPFLNKPQREFAPGQLLGGNIHKLALARAAGQVAWVDELLVPDIELLWENGIETISSCQGDSATQPYRVIQIRPLSALALARDLLPWITSAKQDAEHNAADLSTPWTASRRALAQWEELRASHH